MEINKELSGRNNANVWMMLYSFMDNVKMVMDNGLEENKGIVSEAMINETLLYISDGINGIIRNTIDSDIEI